MIEITDISKAYQDKKVLINASFKADYGKCIGILGGNGSGKSTLLSILAGVLKADNGSFQMEGTDLLCNEKLRRQLVGYVPQGNTLIEELTARDNLRLWYKKDEIEAQLKNGVLGSLGIGEFIDLPVRKMSGGMKKRLSIGCTIASDPRILLMDEPSAALDLPCKELIGEYIKSHKARGGIVILATHDVMELPLCDVLYVLKDGTLTPFIYDGSVSSVVQAIGGQL